MSFAISPYLNNIYKYRNTQVSQSSPGNIIFTLTDPVSDFQCPENTSYMTVVMVGGGGGGGSGGRGGLGGGRRWVCDWRKWRGWNYYCFVFFKLTFFIYINEKNTW
jgi:hypothetical protein